MVAAITRGTDLRLTIDAETDTYAQAIAAVRVACGRSPVVPVDGPDGTVVTRPDPAYLS